MSTSILPPIDRALVPAAGLGTRLYPLTRALPKEMLPLGRRPVLEYVVEELRAAGITRILFVVSPSKPMIEAYFGDGAKWGVRCDYVLQPERKGLGEAILRGEAWAEGQPFVVAFGDCLIEEETHYSITPSSSHPLPLSPPHPQPPTPNARSAPLRRLLETHRRERADATVLTERIARENTRKYGILAPAVPLPDAPTEPFPLADIVEKPAPELAPSTLAVAARWALNPTIFPFLRQASPGPDGEINLTDPVRALLAQGGRVWAVPLVDGEVRRDIGGWESYLLAAARAAASDPEFGPRVQRALGVRR